MKGAIGSRLLVVVACSLAATLGVASGAQAGTLVNAPVEASDSFSGPCFGGIGAAGAAHFQLRSPTFGYLRISLSGGSGDWDVAAYASGRVVTAAASSGPEEVATGYALKGEAIEVQVCRNAGASGTPTLNVGLEQLPEPDRNSAQILRVETPTKAARVALAASGLDTEASGRPGSADVVAYGDGERAALDAASLDYERIPIGSSLGGASELRSGESAARLTPPAEAAALPSGRRSYRRLYDYEQEMKELAAAHPGLARLFELPERSFEGRPVLALELGDNPGAEEGEPVFLQMGLHHGREWPSGELAIEWAYELLDRAAAGDGRAMAILRETKTLVVPVVNPDGFNISREAGQLRADFGARDGHPGATIPVQSAEFQRKNCRLPGAGAVADCGQATTSSRGPLGVDINRNYGGMWGGPGGGLRVTEETYRGPGPFSEPETRNVRAIFSHNQVIAASSNHTYAGLILRAPLVASRRQPPDAALMKRVGARMARATGYASEPGTYLYDSSGGMEGWSYYETGSIDYTPEIGTPGFHPAYRRLIDQWAGATRRAKGGGGMRAATYELERFVRRDGGHVVLAGTGPPGAKLLLRKAFKSRTLPVSHLRRRPTKPLRMQERLATVAEVGADGTYEAHLNPSTRPIVAQRKRGPRKESWKLICVSPEGEKLGSRRLYAERGDRLQLNLTAAGC